MSEGYRYRKVLYRCSDCKSSFDKTRKFPVSKYPHGTALPYPLKDPECPQCKSVKKVDFKNSVTDDTHKHINPANPEASFVGGSAENPVRVPSLGKSNFTKAMDATAEIVMKDYALTNLQDNLRAGDSMAPKLAPELERKVDEVFKPQKPMMGQKGASNLNNALTANINAGRYASQSGGADIVNRAQTSGYKVPTNILHEFQPPRKPS
jgi:rubredoxin